MVESSEKKFERWRRKGDTDALADVFDAIAPRLLRLAVHLVGDVSAAEDLVQSTFVTAIEDAAAWDPSRPLEPWLTGILDNRAKRLLKSRERPLERAAREDIDHDTPLARAVESETSTEIIKAIDQLDEPYRSVMVLNLLHHLEPAAIAHALDRSPGAVRVQLHRGREMVRKLLPAGVLTSAALLASSGRGLAAIKSTVLTYGATKPALTIAATTGGLFVSKKLGLVLGLLFLLVGGAWLIGQISDERRAPTDRVESLSPSYAGAQIADAHTTGPGAARSSATTAQEIQVSGRVMNETVFDSPDTTQPAAGCLVTVAVFGTSDTTQAPQVVARTDEHGVFHAVMGRPTAERTFVRASCVADESFCMALTQKELSTSDVYVDELTLVRNPRTTLRGVVIDGHDAPLAGVRVGLKLWTPAGTKPPESITDAAGRFAVKPEGHLGGEIEAHLDGWAIYECKEIVCNKDGSWPETTVVLVPNGTLRIRVLDVRGEPLVGESVRVEAAPTEPGRVKREFSVMSGRDQAVKTGMDGVASFDDLWIGKRLSVMLGGYAKPVWYEQMREGRLTLADADDGDPIIIGSNGKLELVAQREGGVVIRGIVLTPDRAPVPFANVELRAADALTLGTSPPEQIAETDAAGRFLMQVPRSDPTIIWRITAAEKPWVNKSWVDDEAQAMSRAGSALFDAAKSDPKHEIEIVLAPLLAVAGHVTSKDGVAISGRISAVPLGSASRAAPTSLGRPCFARVGNDGQFRIENLPSGRYDLFMERFDSSPHAFYTFTVATQRFPDIEAGETHLALVFEQEATAHVHVRAVSSHGVVAKMMVLRGRRIERTPSPAEERTLPPDVTIRSLAGWPREAPLNFGGIAGNATPDHRDEFGFDACVGAERDIPPMDPGWSLFGVHAELADGRQCYPMSTAVVYLGPGEHTITFEVVPTTNVEGHLHGMDPDGSLALALVDDAGNLLSSCSSGPARSRLVSTIGARDDGWFQISGAPLGTFRLRVGTRAQLEAGAFMSERKIEIVENGPPLSIDVSR